MITIEQHKKLIELADGHLRADEYRAGHYEWDYGRGACAVGCTIRDAKLIGIVGQETPLSSHFAFDEWYGPGGWYIGKMMDHIFEALPQSERPALTPRLLRALVPGRDYSRVEAEVMVWLQTEGERNQWAWPVIADKLIATIEAAEANELERVDGEPL